MARVSLPWPGVAAVLLAASAAFGQAPSPPAAAPGGRTNPAFLEMIRLRLENVANLTPADGVRIEETKFVDGALRIRGTVVSDEQRESVRREIESLRPRLEKAADVPIASFDFSALWVAERIKAEPRPSAGEPPPAGQTGKGQLPSGQQSGQGQQQSCQGPLQGGEVGCVEEYLGFSPFFAPPPCASDGKGKGHGHRKQKHGKGEDDGAHPYGNPGMGMWWGDGPYGPWGCPGYCAVPHAEKGHKHGGKHGKEQQPYVCPYCGIWLPDGPNAFEPYCNVKAKHGHHGSGHKGHKGAAPQQPPCPYWLDCDTYCPY